MQPYDACCKIFLGLFQSTEYRQFLLHMPKLIVYIYVLKCCLLVSKYALSQEQELSSVAGFDLVFIDYVMTKMDGPAAVQIMRKDMRFTGGIIGVTGNALAADLAYFKECGADLVITKPLSNKKLMDAFHSVMKKNKSSAIS